MNSKPLSLDVIQVNDPCTQSWDAMTGDERVRYCAGCRKHVYDLSAMARTEAEKLVCESAGGLCVRFSRTADGRVRTLDYQPSTAGRRGWRFWASLTACVGSWTAAVCGFFFARAPAAPPPPSPFVMGDIDTPHATPPVAPPAPNQPMMMGFVPGPAVVPPTPPAR